MAISNWFQENTFCSIFTFFWWETLTLRGIQAIGINRNFSHIFLHKLISTKTFILTLFSHIAETPCVAAQGWNEGFSENQFMEENAIKVPVDPNRLDTP